MKSDLGIIIDISKKNSLSLLDKKINIFSKYLGKIDVIDVNKITNSKKNIICNNNKINLLRPNNINELKKILSKKNYVLYYCIGTTFEYFKVNYLLSRIKIKKFVISDLGYNPKNFNYYKRNFYQKIKIFINIRAEYYVKRILILMNIYPRIDFFFESSQYVINSINNGISKKILRSLPFIDFSYYKNVIKINSKHVQDKKTKISEDYIVLIDSGGFDHKDVIFREGKPKPAKRRLYYKNLNLLIKNLQDTYGKKVIICLHPKNNYSLKRKDYKNFKCVKYKTEYYIAKSFLVLVEQGSSIIQAIYLKKKILSLQGDILGNYINERAKLYSIALGLEVFDICNLNFKKFNQGKSNFIKKLELKTKKYNHYIKMNISNNKPILGVEQVLMYLKKNATLRVELNLKKSKFKYLNR